MHDDTGSPARSGEKVPSWAARPPPPPSGHSPSPHLPTSWEHTAPRQVAGPQRGRHQH